MSPVSVQILLFPVWFLVASRTKWGDTYLVVHSLHHYCSIEVGPSVRALVQIGFMHLLSTMAMGGGFLVGAAGWCFSPLLCSAGLLQFDTNGLFYTSVKPYVLSVQDEDKLGLKLCFFCCCGWANTALAPLQRVEPCMWVCLVCRCAQSSLHSVMIWWCFTRMSPASTQNYFCSPMNSFF